MTDINEIMENCNNTRTFEIKEIIQPSDITDLKNWWSQFYKKNTGLMKQIPKMSQEIKIIFKCFKIPSIQFFKR